MLPFFPFDPHGKAVKQVIWSSKGEVLGVGNTVFLCSRNSWSGEGRGSEQRENKAVSIPPVAESLLLHH